MSPSERPDTPEFIASNPLEVVLPRPPSRPIPLRGVGRRRSRIPWFLAGPIAVLFLLVAGGWWAWQSGRLEPYARHYQNFTAWLLNRQESPAGPAEADTYWTCPMHPQIQMDRPGECPICGMTLVQKSRREPETAATDAHKPAAPGREVITVNPRVVQNIGVRSVKVSRRRLVRTVRTSGYVDYNEERKRIVTAWIGGRLDKLHVDFTGMEVEKGAPVAEIYSPELMSTQEEYLLALDYLEELKEAAAMEAALEQAESLVEAAATRLRLWGMTEQQLGDLRRTRKVDPHTTVYAPAGGTVTELMVREGMYVKEGTPLFRIDDLSRVWVQGDVYEQDLPWVHPGQGVDLYSRAHPGTVFRGTISFIDPFLDPKTRTTRVRIEIPNAARELMPGMFVTAEVRSAGAIEQVAVPESAVIRTGKRDLVVVDRGQGRMQPREVTLGPLVEGYYPVLAGLREGEKVVSQASFLIDSESQLQAALQRMGEAPGPSHSHHSH